MNHPRRSRRQHQNQTSYYTGLATRALVAYGTYKAASWAWNKWIGPSTTTTTTNSDDKDEDDNYKYVAANANHSYMLQSPSSSQPSPSPSFFSNENVNANSQRTTTTAATTTTTTTTPRNRNNSRKFIRKRRQQLSKCSIETMGALETFMDTLKSSIESQTDFSRQTKELKQMMKKKKKKATTVDKHGTVQVNQGQRQSLTQNDVHVDVDVDVDIISKQEQLWKEIKIQSMTRMFCSVYVHTVLYLLLIVQIHLLGGHIFRDNLDANDKGKAEDNDYHDDNDNNDNNNNNDKENGNNMDISVHKAVLMKTHEYFFDKGIVTLLEKVKAAVEEETQSWVAISSESGLGTISFDKFMLTINNIRGFVERDDIFIFLDIIKPYEEQEENTENESESHLRLVKDIIDETLDIMESPVFEEAAQESLNVSFNTMKAQLHADLFHNQETSVPFVNVFGKLKKVTSTLYEEPRSNNDFEDVFSENAVKFPNIYAKAMYNLDILKELGDISFN